MLRTKKKFLYCLRVFVGKKLQLHTISPKLIFCSVYSCTHKFWQIENWLKSHNKNLKENSKIRINFPKVRILSILTDGLHNGAVCFFVFWCEEIVRMFVIWFVFRTNLARVHTCSPILASPPPQNNRLHHPVFFPTKSLHSLTLTLSPPPLNSLNNFIGTFICFYTLELL